MCETALKEYIQPFPGIPSFIFAPPATRESRTWIFGANEEPESVLNFHLAAFLAQGWHVLESAPSVVAERGGSGVSVSASRRRNETRIVYEVYPTYEKD